jgi:hypothetical protein
VETVETGNREEKTKMKKNFFDLILEAHKGEETLRHIEKQNPVTGDLFESTHEILQYIPEEKLKMIVKLFRTLNNLRQMTERYKYLPKTSAFPYADLGKIKKILTRQNWLPKKDIEDILTNIQGRLEKTPKGMRATRSLTLEKEVKRLNITKPLDVPLLITAYSLACHMTKTRDLNWKLICDFLQEQELINANESEECITEAMLRDRIRKIPFQRLVDLYSSYIEVYSSPAPLDAGLADLTVHVIEVTFPTWQEIEAR